MVGTGATARYHWMEMDADIATPPPHEAREALAQDTEV